MVKWRSTSPGTRSKPSKAPLSVWSRVLATTARPIIAIGAVVILGSAVWLVADNLRSDHTDWERHGPSGAFPHSGPQAPVDSVKVSNAPPQGVVYGGIAVQALQGSDTLTASILRTGKAFWRLRRAGHRIDQAAFDPGNGSVFVLWTSDKHGKEHALDVTLIDARKGKPGWATPLPRDLTFGNGDHVLVHHGQVVAIGANGMTALDEHSGRQRWTTRWPGCTTALPVNATQAEAAAKTLVVQQECGDIRTENTKAGLAAYDAAIGARRWARGFAHWWPGGHDYRAYLVDFAPLDADRLAVWSNAEGGVIGLATGVLKTDPRSHDWHDSAIASGIRVNGCHTQGELIRAICAHDPATGASLWSRTLPDHKFLSIGSNITVVDDRVYALVTGAPKAPISLAIFDLHTGQPTKRLEIPQVAPTDGFLSMTPQCDGALQITDRLTADAPTYLLSRPQ